MLDDSKFVDCAMSLGIQLTETQIELFRVYERHLSKWARRVRLVSRNDIKHLRMRHFVDSLALAPLLPNGTHRLLDLGSGGGFPGVPIKIVRPEIEIDLLESTRMKSLFLKDIQLTLGLPGLNVYHARAEEFLDEFDLSIKYCIVTARAVGPLPFLWKLAEPLLNSDGCLMAFKGPGALKEFGDQIPEGLHVREVKQKLPQLNRERVIVVISRTPGQSS